VTVKRGYSLTRIARRNHVSLDSLKEANPKIQNLNVIHIGETVYVPKIVPALAANGTAVYSPPDTSPEEAWAGAVAQAIINSPLKSVTVAPGDTLTKIARLNNCSLDSLEAANPQIKNPRLIQIGETVYVPNAAPAQVVTGAGNPEIQPIIAAMAEANAAQSQESWDKVTEITYNFLIKNNTGAYPERAAEAQVQRLNALEPDNPRFAAAIKAALTAALRYWSELGVTGSKLGPIIEAYSNGGQANGQLKTAIEKSLTDAASQAAGPAARSEAIKNHAAIIQLVGPQDAAFHTTVDEARYDLQVKEPAQAVIDAYAKGGAAAAAAALKTAAQNAGNTDNAGEIIKLSQGTIDKITAYLGAQASDAPLNPLDYEAPAFGPIATQLEFNQIYADLSQSVAAANELTFASGSNGQVSSVSLSPGGKAAASLVANSLARNAPKNLRLSQNFLYGGAARDAIASGDGAALTLAAAAAAAKQQGNAGLVRCLAEGAAAGIKAISSKTKSDALAYAGITENMNKLRAAWGPSAPDEMKLAEATKGYLAAHPEVVQNGNSQLTVLGRDGDAIVGVKSAWQSYSAELGGIAGQQALAAAAQSLTGTDKEPSPSAALAVSQSLDTSHAVATALEFQVLSKGGVAGSVAQTLLASPVWGLPKSWRTFFNAFFRQQIAEVKLKDPSAPRPYSQGTFTILSAAGMGLTIESFLANGLFKDSTAKGFSESVYVSLGFPKYAAELITGMARWSTFQNLVRNSALFELETTGLHNSLFLNLPGRNKIDLSELLKTDWFKILGSAYYGVGAIAALLEAEDEMKAGDRWGAVLTGGVALGAALNAGKPVLGPALEALSGGEVAGEAVATAGSGIGTAATAGILLYEGIKAERAAEEYQVDSTRFLQQCFGLSHELAYELSAPWNELLGSRSGGPRASAALQAYAKAYGIPFAELLQKLDKQPIDTAKEFIDVAANMPTYNRASLPPSVRLDNGYAVSMPSSDNPKMVGKHKVTMRVDRSLPFTVAEDYPANSLQQLDYWADYLFGKNQLH
jgi:LysM repeat protein